MGIPHIRTTDKGFMKIPGKIEFPKQSVQVQLFDICAGNQQLSETKQKMIKNISIHSLI